MCPYHRWSYELDGRLAAALENPSLGDAHELQLTVDGQVERAVGVDESVVVRRGEHMVSLVRLSGQTFFRTMRTKLNWAARPPERA